MVSFACGEGRKVGDFVEFPPSEFTVKLDASKTTVDMLFAYLEVYHKCIKEGTPTFKSLSYPLKNDGLFFVCVCQMFFIYHFFARKKGILKTSVKSGNLVAKLRECFYLFIIYYLLLFYLFIYLIFFFFDVFIFLKLFFLFHKVCRSALFSKEDLGTPRYADDSLQTISRWRCL